MIERQLEECYQHMKPYIKNNKILKEMCCRCENYCGEQHDYEECRNEPCFKCWLGLMYLDWYNSFS